MTINHPDWLNYIQNLPVEKHGQIFLTLNPPFEPDPKLVFREFVYDHPVLDASVSVPHALVNNRGTGSRLLTALPLL